MFKYQGHKSPKNSTSIRFFQKVFSKKVFLFELLKILKKTVRGYCKSILSELDPINEIKTFLSEYCRRVI